MINFLKQFRSYTHQFICVFLIFITLVAFWQVKDLEFVSFDDDCYVSDNPHVIEGLSWKNVRWALSSNLFSDSPHVLLERIQPILQS